MLDYATLYPLLHRHREDLTRPVEGFTLRGRVLDFNARRYLMGVINLSTDSAYRESICHDSASAIARGRQLAVEGAELVDIGAESTLPDARRVGPEEQIAMVRPVVEALAADGLLVSVESYHPAVLEAAARAGAAVFNLTGEREATAVLALAARFDAAVIHCHVQGETVRETSDFRRDYTGDGRAEDTGRSDIVGMMASDFARRLEQARASGVTRNIIDPGLGFYYRNLGDGAERVRHQLSLFAESFRLRALGVPVMNILPHAPHIYGETNRRQAEPFFAVPALLGGSHIIRTHEVAGVARIRDLLGDFPTRHWGGPE